MTPLVEVEDLRVSIPLEDGVLRPVRGISFSVSRGETLCIVGESGCGKSLTSLALMGLLPSRAEVLAARMRFGGRDLLAMSEREMNAVRGDRMSMIFQEPMTSLNPAYTVGNQLEEVYLRHRGGGAMAARERALHLLEKVGITGAEERLCQYPHQLSGGLRQRVMIAMALMCGPQLIIADEPTTALDVTVQAQILRLLKDLQRELDMALILITHDLGVVARIADRVAVMYAGQIVEAGTATEVFNDPSHPYTRGLLGCIPIPGRVQPGERLGSIPGIVPALTGELTGCAFANRCSFTQEACLQTAVPFREKQPMNCYRCLFEPAGRVPAGKMAPDGRIGAPDLRHFAVGTGH
jgi:peptide/nickel transport system ATP-binding protein